jgi:hypothetical protein
MLTGRFNRIVLQKPGLGIYQGDVLLLFKNLTKLARTDLEPAASYLFFYCLFILRVSMRKFFYISFVIIYLSLPPVTQTQQLPFDSENRSEEIELSLISEKEEYMQGETINLLARIKNNSDQQAFLAMWPVYHLFFKNEMKYIPVPEEYVSIPQILMPFSETLRMLKPLLRGYKILEAGEYELFISFGYGIKSNSIPIKITQLPDSLKKELSDMSIPDYNSPIKYDDYFRTKYEEYKDSYFAEEFLALKLTSFSFYDALKGEPVEGISKTEAQNLYKEFIIKYPNHPYSIGFFERLYELSDNKEFVEDLITELKENKGSFLYQTLINNKNPLKNDIPLIKDLKID